MARGRGLPRGWPIDTTSPDEPRTDRPSNRQPPKAYESGWKGIEPHVGFACAARQGLQERDRRTQWRRSARRSVQRLRYQRHATPGASTRARSARDVGDGAPAWLTQKRSPPDQVPPERQVAGHERERHHVGVPDVFQNGHVIKVSSASHHGRSASTARCSMRHAAMPRLVTGTISQANKGESRCVPVGVRRCEPLVQRHLRRGWPPARMFGRVHRLTAPHNGGERGHPRDQIRNDDCDQPPTKRHVMRNRGVDSAAAGSIRWAPPESKQRQAVAVHALPTCSRRANRRGI